jgi:transcriptional regulator with XRE-family HTH domain
VSGREDALRRVSEQLVRFRSEEGLSLEEASEEAEIDYERLAAAEAGELALDEAELVDLADVYGIEVTQFFGGHVTPLSYLFGA